MENLEKISFRFIPSPHLLIKKADLKIRENETKVLSKLENIKVFISILDLYKNENFEIDRIEVNKANLYLNELSLKNFIQNLKNNIVKKFLIKRSTIFFRDKNDDIILLSKIKNFNYKIDFVNSKKILKIEGNIFDSDYEFKYLIDYNFPNIQNINIELKNPNIILDNKLVDKKNSNEFLQEGIFTIRFLTKKNIINYEIIKNSIKFTKENSKNTDFNLNGLINFKPFYFDLVYDHKKIDLIDIENLLYTIFINKKLKYENLSGILKINLKDIDNKTLQSGLLSLQFGDTYINVDKNLFYLSDFATLEIVDYEYLNEIDQILQMKVKINVINEEKFNRFLFKYRKNKILNKNVYFTYQYNSNTKTHFLSNVSSDGFTNNTEFYRFNNLQQLKNVLIDENVFKTD